MPQAKPQDPRRPLVLGNWKMNGDMVANETLLGGLLEQGAEVISGGRIDLGVAVPAPYLFQAAVRLRGRGVMWGAQEMSEAASGAFTGEVSVGMLQDFEAGFVLIGHSERRARHAESNERINAKVQAAIDAHVLAVVCVGETLEERQAGRAQEVVLGQVSAAFKGIDADLVGRCVVAYEPVWAIGTGVTASPEDAQEMHGAIRQALVASIGSLEADAMRILYGGSCSPSTAPALFAKPDIDGGLVGGASLKAADFVAILQAADARAASALQSH